MGRVEQPRDSSAIGRRSRRKGANSERAVAAMLTQWWRRLEPDCQFVRTPSSGGWSTKQVRAEFRASGDVMTTAAKFPFCVEIKRREQFSWDRVLASKPSPVWAWWAQTCRAAEEQKAMPMLWLRRNNELWRVVLPDAKVTSWICSLIMPRFLFAQDLCVAGSSERVSIVAATALLAIDPSALLPRMRKRNV